MTNGASSRSLVIAGVVILALVLGYAFRWEYSMLGSMNVRTNRWTGTTERLHPGRGWVDLGHVESSRRVPQVTDDLKGEFANLLREEDAKGSGD